MHLKKFWDRLESLSFPVSNHKYSIAAYRSKNTYAKVAREIREEGNR
jgi:hypothetical protein